MRFFKEESYCGGYNYYVLSDCENYWYGVNMDVGYYKFSKVNKEYDFNKDKTEITFKELPEFIKEKIKDPFFEIDLLRPKI